MGYITTFSIYNDGIHGLKDNPEQFIDKLISASHGAYSRDHNNESFGHGSHANLVTVQKPRHADDHTCYVHMGNTVTEMNPYSQHTRYIAEKFPDFFDGLLKHLEQNVRELKKLKQVHKK
jgi:hypothetical protein